MSRMEVESKKVAIPKGFRVWPGLGLCRDLVIGFGMTGMILPYTDSVHMFRCATGS